ncbi:unnamed protein product, partial [Owenia fusiformis]
IGVVCLLKRRKKSTDETDDGYQTVHHEIGHPETNTHTIEPEADHITDVYEIPFDGKESNVPQATQSGVYEQINPIEEERSRQEALINADVKDKATPPGADPNEYFLLDEVVPAIQRINIHPGDNASPKKVDPDSAYEHIPIGEVEPTRHESHVYQNIKTEAVEPDYVNFGKGKMHGNKD